MTVIWSTSSLTWTVPPELATTAFPPTTVAAAAFPVGRRLLPIVVVDGRPTAPTNRPSKRRPRSEPPFESFELLDPLSEAMFCRSPFRRPCWRPRRWRDALIVAGDSHARAR